MLICETIVLHKNNRHQRVIRFSCVQFKRANRASAATAPFPCEIKLACKPNSWPSYAEDDLGVARPNRLLIILRLAILRCARFGKATTWRNETRKRLRLAKRGSSFV